MPNLIIRLKNDQLLEQCCEHLCTQNIAHKRLNSLNAVSLPREKFSLLQQIVNQDDIEMITEDTKIHLIKRQQIIKKKSKRIPSISIHVPWGMIRIGAIYSAIPKHYYRPKVAILDSGLSLHPNLAISPVYVNFTDEKSAQDGHGHGTHLAGIVGGYSPFRQNRSAFHGVYPRLKLISVKAFGEDGSGPLSAIIQGIEWCLEQQIKVINMSFGIQQHHPLLHEIVKIAHRRGITMVAASGNEGKPGLTFPARYPEVISVGSINKESQVSAFSQFGTNLDLVAPGEEIVSTWLNQSYAKISGTSMSCAHVTGAVALILALKPHLTPVQVKELLLANTEKLTASFFIQGHGLVSIKKIIASLKK